MAVCGTGSLVFFDVVTQDRSWRMCLENTVTVEIKSWEKKHYDFTVLVTSWIVDRLAAEAIFVIKGISVEVYQ